MGVAKQGAMFLGGYAVFHAKVVGGHNQSSDTLKKKASRHGKVVMEKGQSSECPRTFRTGTLCRQPEPEMMVWHHSQRQRSRYRRTMPVVPQLGHVWGGVTADWWASTDGSDAAVRDVFGKG